MWRHHSSFLSIFTQILQYLTFLFDIFRLTHPIATRIKQLFWTSTRQSNCEQRPRYGEAHTFIIEKARKWKDIAMTDFHSLTGLMWQLTAQLTSGTHNRLPRLRQISNNFQRLSMTADTSRTYRTSQANPSHLWINKTFSCRHINVVVTNRTQYLVERCMIFQIHAYMWKCITDSRPKFVLWNVAANMR